MKAKKVNEAWDRRDTGYPEPMGDIELVDFEENQYGDITFYYESDGATGTWQVGLSEIAEYSNLEDDEDITDEIINYFEKKNLDLNNIEWEEDEGPNPDDLRDKYID
jgi:hypothetical protein